jgi:hypothetical protein
VQDSFDSDRILADAKENHLVTGCRQSRFSACFWTQLAEQRLPSDLLHSGAEQTKQSRCMERAVLSNEIYDLFQVNRNARG